MNTKKRRLPPRRVLLPANRNQPESVTAAGAKSSNSQFKSGSGEIAEQSPSNQLLAGYLANEFLTYGTLFGEPLDLARTLAVTASLPVPLADPLFIESAPCTGPQELSGRAEDHKRRRYLEVSYLFRADGTYLPGIVNPPQLARFLKL